MNKRGEGEGGFSSVRLILALAIAIILINILVNVYYAKKNENDVNSKTNFYTLANVLDKINVDDNNFYFSMPSYAYYISNNHILVGFNRVGDRIYDVCGKPESATKPLRCKGKACICLYKETGDEWYMPWGDDNDFDSDTNGGEIIDCRTLENVDHIFTLNYRDDKVRNEHNVRDATAKNVIGHKVQTNLPRQYYDEEYSDLFIYGQCEDYYGDVNFNSQNIYIEMLNFKGKNYLFIAGISKKIEDRATKLQKQVLENIKKVQGVTQNVGDQEIVSTQNNLFGNQK